VISFDISDNTLASIIIANPLFSLMKIASTKENPNQHFSIIHNHKKTPTNFVDAFFI
jgi:hypothetical protein